jgi:hypothetical protein
MSGEDELKTVGDAMRLLGTSKRKIALLIAEGVLPAVVDPLDKRFKQVKRSDVEALLARSLPKGTRREGKDAA